MTIKAIGVWDTVGALGTPRIGWLERVGLQSSASKLEGFYNTQLSSCVENAFQALALDERRASFSPTLWERPPGDEGRDTKLRQVWFPGVHSNVGGSYPDQELANITLAWMMSQLMPFLDLDTNVLFEEQAETQQYYKETDQPIRSWSFGELYNSFRGVYALGGSQTRTPGAYCELDPYTAKSTGHPLRHTHEYIHPSVRVRYRLGGPGAEDKGTYECKALHDWKIEIVDPGTRADGGRGKGVAIAWKYEGDDERVTKKVIYERPLEPLEKELLYMCRDRQVVDYALDSVGVARKASTSRRVRRRSRQ